MSREEVDAKIATSDARCEALMASFRDTLAMQWRRDMEQQNEANRKMLAENRQMTDESRKMLAENRLLMEKVGKQYERTGQMLAELTQGRVSHQR